MAIGAVLVLLGLMAAEPPRVLALRTLTQGSRAVVQVSSAGELPEVNLAREGADVLVLELHAAVPADLAVPAGVGQVLGLTLSKARDGMVLRVRTTPGAPYEVQRESGVLNLLVGEVVEGSETTEQGELAERYRLLFPSAPETEEGGQSRPGTAPADQDNDRVGFDRDGNGLRVGPLTFNPSIVFSYVRARGSFTTFQSNQQWRDYLQVEPSLGARLGFINAHLFGLRVGYRPRFRGFSSVSELQKVSHEAFAEFRLPITSSLTFNASDRYVRGILETDEVDPGREYAARLGTFQDNDFQMGLKMDAGGLLIADVGVGRGDLKFLDASSFFSYRRETANARLAYRLGEQRQLGVTYLYTRVPPPSERPIAATRSHAIGLELSGEILSLTTGRISAGYLTQTNPNLTSGNQTFDSFVMGVQVKREFSRTSSLSVFADRSSQLSAFEDNAFYVTNSIGALGTVPLKVGFTFTAGATYRRNDYHTDSAVIGEPREDRIKSWTVGIGRPLGKRAYLRGDYLRERRNSNIPGLSTITEAFSVQFGIGLFANPGTGSR